MWCEAVGIPAPNILWLFNNKTLLNTSENNTENSFESRYQKAIFRNITLEQAGVYTCQAENWAGTDFLTMNLIVQSKIKKIF